MASVNVAGGRLEVRTLGPADSSRPPVVFVHGFLVDSRLWDGVAIRLADRGIRSYLVDWPLGSHRESLDPSAELSPHAVARMVAGVLETLDLDDVTLVGNDTGGAICQLVMAEGSSRVGRVVLTNCDAFDNFPPKVFLPLFFAVRHPWLTRLLLAPMRWRLVRHSPLAYGLLMRRPRDAELTRRWVTPAMTDARIREDIARFTRGLDRRSLVEAAPRLAEFAGPVRIVWGADDRCFTLASARRLTAAFPDAELITVPGATTFVPIDEPGAVADAIEAVCATSQAVDRV